MNRTRLAKKLFENQLSIKEVAFEMNISYNTAKSYKRLLGFSSEQLPPGYVRVRTCGYCSKTFVPHVSRPRQQFCSRQCGNTALSANKMRGLERK